MVNLQKRQYIREPKLKKSAHGAPCMINSPVCNYNPETSVLAHLDSSLHGKGTGIKADDSAAAIACSNCHDYVSLNTDVPKQERDLIHLHGVISTYAYWINEGVIKIA